ncbi:MAG TPA: lysylphosphatidylglycerol synthase transmembrane domain-containing protein [Acidimicrobiales bacterium]|nr:lysylphosphatidylglycerol synthase transmembrane domain-containing protein [Acidimicrobiales bacterium]
MSVTRGRLAGASTAIGAVLAVIAGVFVGRALVREWDEVSSSLSDASPGWIVVAVVLAIAGMTAIALPWRRALHLLGAELSWGQTIARYYLGEVGKYVPGGVWPVLGRGELARRAGVGRAPAYSSVALSLITLYLAAMFLALLGVPAMMGEGSGGGYFWVLLLLPLGLVGLHHAVLERVRGLGERVLRRPINTTIPPWRATLSLVVLYVPAWLLIGTATWAIARGLGQDVAWLDVAPAAVLSWIVGFVLVPVPGGVGVREAAFVAAVSGMDSGVAAATAVLARAVFVLVDALGALGASGWLARHRIGGGRGEGASEEAGEPAVTTEAAGSPAL